MAKNVERKPGFTQVCVWEGHTIEEANMKAFEGAAHFEWGVRVQYLEQFFIEPLVYDEDDDEWYKCDGLRGDILFAVHDDDIEKFSVPRLVLGIRWIEDALFSANYQRGDYPSRVWDYQSWDPENMTVDAMMGLGNLFPSNIGGPTICHIWPDHPSCRP